MKWVTPEHTCPVCKIAFTGDLWWALGEPMCSKECRDKFLATENQDVDLEQETQEELPFD